LSAEKARWEKIFSCLGKGLGADCTKQISLVHQVGKEGIEFVLNSGFKAGQHGNGENGKSQDALTEKSSTVRCAQSLADEQYWRE